MLHKHKCGHWNRKTHGVEILQSQKYFEHNTWESLELLDFQKIFAIHLLHLFMKSFLSSSSQSMIVSHMSSSKILAIIEKKLKNLNVSNIVLTALRTSLFVPKLLLSFGDRLYFISMKIQICVHQDSKSATKFFELIMTILSRNPNLFYYLLNILLGSFSIILLNYWSNFS